jgi:hypothetical protein
MHTSPDKEKSSLLPVDLPYRTALFTGFSSFVIFLNGCSWVQQDLAFGVVGNGGYTRDGEAVKEV